MPSVKQRLADLEAQTPQQPFYVSERATKDPCWMQMYGKAMAKAAKEGRLIWVDDESVLVSGFHKEAQAGGPYEGGWK